MERGLQSVWRNCGRRQTLQDRDKYYDDTSNAQKSATLAQKLIKEDKVNFLLGPYGTSANLQVSTVAEKNQIPMVEGNGVAESVFGQVIDTPSW